MRRRVLVVDDQPLMRSALTIFVDSAQDLQVVGEAGDGAVAVHQCEVLAPDVVLMDIQMPVMDGIEATRRITQARPGVKVVAVTTFPTEDTVVPALRAGASGYLLKDCEPQALLDSIRQVLDGQAALSPSLTWALVEAIREQPATPDRAVTTRARQALTDREFEVVDLLAQGLSNAQMARELYVSEATIKARLGQITGKLRVHSRVQLLVRACELGLVQPRLRAHGR